MNRLNKIIFLFAFLVSVFLILFLIHKCIVTYKNKRENGNDNDAALEKHQIPCKNIMLPSESIGLILDAMIMCDKIPDLESHLGSRNIIIETTSCHPTAECPIINKPINPKQDLLLVNLDCTDFNNAPNTLICKTKQAYRILKTKFKNKTVVYTGFTSVDRFRRRTNCGMDYTRFIHICGKSPHKGTLKIVEAWINHPEFPRLIIKVYDGMYSDIQTMLKNKVVENLEINNNFVSEDELSEMYNTCGIHLCPSNAEGWGHYIAEAKSVKAVVLYTNAPCMNETFTDGVDGISIECDTTITNTNGMCPFYEIEPINIAKAVQKVLSIPLTEKQRIGNNARASYLKNDEDFTFNFKTLIYNL